MKRLFSTIALALFTTALFAGPIDGKWQFETKTPEGKGKRGPRTISTTLDFHSSGDDLTGQVSSFMGKRSHSTDLVDGKVDGNNVSFTTIQKGKNGERKFLWSGVLDGDQLKLVRKREGGKRGTEIVAKRQ